MNSVCQHLQESAAYIRNWLEKQPGVKEESLTDWLLFDTATRVPNISYRAFTRHEEARETGADWEWWFVFPTKSFRFRVQAKKLSPTNDNYPELARTNRHGLQIDKLLSNSESANAIPLYAFYSALNAPLLISQ